jgi:hypothetical protein
MREAPTSSWPLMMRLLLSALVLAGMTGPALAWVYPEHRDIAVLAVETLDPQHRAEFDRLWGEARAGHEVRLCEQGVDSQQGVKPDCIDWAALSGIGGDHSCSSAQMMDTVNNTEWVLKVAAIAAQLKVDLSRISTTSSVHDQERASTIADIRRQLENEAAKAQRINALRSADTKLQTADTGYARRAGSNNAHFLLARPRTDFTVEDYVRMTLRPGSPTNALGVFAWYHLSALQKATRLAHESLTPEQRTALASAMLFDEAFALHFLEDVFAAGHVAGTWGEVSQRKGTHDFYNENGLEVATWQGGAKTMVLMGDAHMRTEDAERAAAVVRMSIEQLLETATARPPNGTLAYVPTASSQPDALDVCKNNTLMQRPEGLRATPEAIQLGVEIVLQTPVPSLDRGLGAMPRFREEVGPFIGIAGGLDGRYMDGGFTGLESGNGLMGGADLSVRAGYGLEGVLGEAGDGLIYLSVGYRGDLPSTNKFNNTASAEQGGTLAAAIPARSGFSTRLRMPFYLIPGDLLLLSPLYFISPSAYEDLAVTAVNGGLIPWQLGWATRFGRFQFVLGREIGAAFYGLGRTDTLLVPGVTPDAPPRVISFKSTYLDFPVLEYRPYRAFDMTQTSEVRVQVFFGVDIPHGGNVVSPPGAPGVKMQRVYSVGARAVFDWRRYF